MPTTRARSRATKEPSVEEFEEHIENHLEELNGRLRRAFKELYEDFHGLIDEHNALVDSHNALRDVVLQPLSPMKRFEEESSWLTTPTTLLEEVYMIYSFLFFVVSRVVGFAVLIGVPVYLFIFSVSFLVEFLANNVK